MANKVANNILVCDSSGEGKHVLLSNLLGEIVDNVYESDDTKQPLTTKSVSEIDLTQYRVIGEGDVDVQDQWYLANTVKENGVYLLEYHIEGKFTLDGSEDADPEDAVFEAIFNSDVSFTAKRFIRVNDYTTDSLSFFANDRAYNTTSQTLTTYLSVEEQGVVVSFASEPVSWGDYVLAKYRIVGTRTFTLTKVG